MREFLNYFAVFLRSANVRAFGKKGCLPNEGNDIKRRRVVGIAKEVHQGVNDASRDFREFDGSNVNGLNQQLPVLRSLKTENLIKPYSVQIC